MFIDEVVGRSLSELADGVKPMPDPYGRAVARLRRSRRRRLTAAVAAATMLAGAAAIVPGAARQPQLPAADAGSGWKLMQQWAQRLADSPVRGQVGQDKAFVADFAGRVLAHQQAGAYRRQWTVKEARVLFVDDIGPHRVAFVAFVLTTPDPKTQWPHASAWFRAPKGASAQDLADPSAVSQIGDGLEPTAEQTLPDGGVYSIGLAPAQCRYETAPLPLANVWAAEPTGSYIVRTPQTERAEWWRVVCGGVVRKEQPAPSGPFLQRVTVAELSDAVAVARGQVDPEFARMNILVAEGYATVGTPKLLWGGRISGTEAQDGHTYDGKALMTVMRAVRGGWAGMVDIRYDEPTADGSTGAGASFHVESDPLAADAVLAVHLGQQTSTVFVLAPEKAVTVRALDEQGRLIAQKEVTHSTVLFKVANPAEVTFEAVDANGAIIGRAKTAQDFARLGVLDRFGEP